MKTGYKFFVSCNVHGAIELGLNLGMDDLSVMDVVIELSSMKYTKKRTNNKGELEFNIPWERVKDRLPLLKYQSRTVIKQLLKNLCDEGLLVNVSNAKTTWFKFGSNYDAFINWRDLPSAYTDTKNDASASADTNRPQSRTHEGDLPSASADGIEFTSFDLTPESKQRAREEISQDDFNNAINDKVKELRGSSFGIANNYSRFCQLKTQMVRTYEERRKKAPDLKGLCDLLEYVYNNSSEWVKSNFTMRLLNDKWGEWYDEANNNYANKSKTKSESSSGRPIPPGILKRHPTAIWESRDLIIVPETGLKIRVDS